MSNSGEFYDHTTYPATGSQGSSAALRAELDSIEQGFNLLPALSGQGGKIVKINTGGTAMESSSVLSEDGTDVTVSGDLYVTGTQIGRSASKKLTLPDVNGDTFALLDEAQTLTNKTISLTDNSVSMTLAELNTAITDSNLASGSDSETLTNKSISFTNNTLSATLAELNSAISDASVASLAGSETLTNKVLTSPDINGGSLDGATVDNTVIGGGTPAAATFTDLIASAVSYFTSTAFLGIPAGTTAQRGSPAVPAIRYNETLSSFEGFADSSWGSLGGGATGGGGDQVFLLSAIDVTEDFTVPAGHTAITGSLRGADGVTIDGEDDSRLAGV